MALIVLKEKTVRFLPLSEAKPQISKFVYIPDVPFKFFKVTGDSLLIHEFAYSLFIGLCSVTF